MLVVSPVISVASRSNQKKKNELFPKCVRTRQVAYPCKVSSKIKEREMANFHF
jgi:hypothetical protein